MLQSKLSYFLQFLLIQIHIYLQVRILTDAVDDITTVDDFLAVSESHILDDVNRCITALQVRII